MTRDPSHKRPASAGRLHVGFCDNGRPCATIDSVARLDQTPKTLDIVNFTHDGRGVARWPEGHAQKAADLIQRLETHPDFSVSKLSWASGLIVAVKRG